MSTLHTPCPAPHDGYNRPNPRSRYTLSPTAYASPLTSLIRGSKAPQQITLAS